MHDCRWPMVPLGPGGFLRHLACPKAPFSAPYFTSFSLPIWDPCLWLSQSYTDDLQAYVHCSVDQAICASLHIAVEAYCLLLIPCRPGCHQTAYGVTHLVRHSSAAR